MFPLVLELAADRIPVTVTCRVLGFSKQAFFAWRRNPVSQRDWDEGIVGLLDRLQDDRGPRRRGPAQRRGTP